MNTAPGSIGSYTRVDFAYSFGTPHRLTVALPDSSHKTLLDAEQGSLRLAWSYASLAELPYGPFATPKVDWELRLHPSLDGQPFAHSAWQRLEGWLPALDIRYQDARGSVRLQVVAGRSAVVAHMQLENLGEQPHTLRLHCEKPGGWCGLNPAWLDPEDPGDALLAAWLTRADRVLVLGLGAQSYTAGRAQEFIMSWTLGPGEQAEGWLVRPYSAYAADLPALRTRDWAIELEAGLQTWRDLLARAMRVELADERVRNGFYACLADLFVMREPVLGGQIGTVPGTEMYRASNSYEPAIVTVALDQVGYPHEAAAGYQVNLEAQQPDGDWTEPGGWSHHMWGTSGMKAWAVLSHYRLTGDRTYLEALYPRLLASSRWNERMRARTRVAPEGERPLTYGLFPRGMGDAGLMDGNDLYGIFIPHNIWATFADRLTVEAAEILGQTQDLPELRRIYETARDDLLAAMERGALSEGEYRRIACVPGKVTGSSWGALNALFPCGLLPPDHELIAGTIRKMEEQLSPGGLPVHTGWMVDGMWVAIALDNLAEAHLARNEGDAAVEYLYAVLNHGTPLFTWCEERGQAPNTDKTSGDRQHLWTPVAVVRALRDMLVMEEGDGLHLARGTARWWLGSGTPLGVAGAHTDFGELAYQLRYRPDRGCVEGEITFPARVPPAWVQLHVRLPRGLRLASVDTASGATLAPDGTGLRWKHPTGRVHFVACVG